MLRAVKHILIHRSKELFRRTLDIVMPRRCVACKQAGTFLCASCKNTLPYALNTENDMVACYEYNNVTVRRVLWKFKYGGAKELADVFAETLAEEIIATLAESISPPEDGEAIGIIPVPLHPARLRERGYNQAECIAQGIVKKIPEAHLYSSLLIRTKNTESQTKMKGRAARERNVVDAFMVSSTTTLPRICIVVDDIITSGATTRACTALLKSAGYPWCCVWQWRTANLNDEIYLYLTLDKSRYLPPIKISTGKTSRPSFFI